MIRTTHKQTVTVPLSGENGSAGGTATIRGLHGRIKTVAVSAGASNGSNLVAALKDEWSGQTIFSNTGNLASPVVKEVGLEVSNAGGSGISGTERPYLGSADRNIVASGASGNAGTLTFKILWEMTPEEYRLNFGKPLVS